MNMDLNSNARENESERSSHFVNTTIITSPNLSTHEHEKGQELSFYKYV